MPYDDTSYKVHCPGCNGNTSDIARGYREEGKCPVCGLPQEVLREIWRARESHASVELKEQFESMAVRAGKAEAQVRRLTRKVDAVRDALEGEHD